MPPLRRWGIPGRRIPSLHISLAICGIALVIEALVGYPARVFAAIGHPVTWIGATLSALDRRFNLDHNSPATRRRMGAAAIGCLLLACGGVAWLLVQLAFALLPLAIAIPWLALLASSGLAQRSLDEHVGAVADALDRDGLATARKNVAQIVGRDVAALDAAGVSRAAIESLAENFADGVVAPAFWLALGGLPGLVVYKAVNTADSMIGHRTVRHLDFGRFAARLDDVANWLPARLAALAILAAAAMMPGASAAAAWRIMLRDAHGHPSPNAGWPEAAMAGALALRLGGARSYGGALVEDAAMGDGDALVDAAAIRRALVLYRIGCGVQIATIVVLAMFIARW